MSYGELLIRKRACAYDKTGSCADEQYTTAPLNRAARDSLSKGKQDRCGNTVAPLSQIQKHLLTAKAEASGQLQHGMATGLMRHQYVYVTPLPFELVRKSDLERARLVALRT